MEEKLKAMWNGIKIFKLYGTPSVWKRIENKLFFRKANEKLIEEAHVVSALELENQKCHRFHTTVKFSIITPLYNTPKEYLKDLIESLERQTYENWELCLGDGSDSEHAYVGEICRDYQRTDNRIVYKVLEKNKGISENTNECIKLASGDYYGLLDHDDILHPSALFEIMSVIDSEAADFIYSDEAKFTDDVSKIDSALLFNFKPGFGKYDLRSHNYICHFTVFNKKLLEGESRFFRAEYDGSQDHDMVLRLTEKAKKIIHVPKVLYYWRMHSNSVSQDLDSKSYAVDAAIGAVTNQLERQGEAGKVASSPPFRTLYKIQYDIKGVPLVSVVLCNVQNQAEVEKFIMRTRESTSYRAIQFVYEGKSNIEIENEERKIRITNVIVEDGDSKSERWNKLINQAEGEYIVLMDMKMIPMNDNWIQEMLMLSQKDDVCCVGPKIIYRDQTIAYGGGVLWKTEKSKLRIIGTHYTASDMGYEAIMCHVRNTTFTMAACMMFSKRKWKELGGFKNVGCGYEDIDFCLRGLNQGLNNVWTCYATLCCDKNEIMSKISADKAEQFEKMYEKNFENEIYFHSKWESLGLV